MKMFSKDKTEFDNLKKEFDETRLAKNLIAVKRDASITTLTFLIGSIIFYDVFSDDGFTIFISIIIISGMLNLILSVLIRTIYYNFLFKYESTMVESSTKKTK